MSLLRNCYKKGEGMPKPSRGLDRQVTVKFTAAQVESLKREARQRKMKLAELIRHKLYPHTDHTDLKGDRPQ